MGLTARQKAFIEAYQGNATEAALKAGYKRENARAQGQRLLTKADISQAIQDREEKRQNALIATREERMMFFTRIMRNEGEETRDRLKAADLMCKANGDYLERIETAQTGPVVFKWQE